MVMKEHTLRSMTVLESEVHQLKPQPHLHSGCVSLVGLLSLSDLHISNLWCAINLAEKEVRITGNIH